MRECVGRPPGRDLEENAGNCEEWETPKQGKWNGCQGITRKPESKVGECWASLLIRKRGVGRDERGRGWAFARRAGCVWVEVMTAYVAVGQANS